MNIEPDASQQLDSGAYVSVSEIGAPLSSAALHQALLLRLVHSNKTPEICPPDQLIHVAQRERNDILDSADDQFKLAWFKGGNNDSDEYPALLEKLDNAIRDRLSKLAVHGLDRLDQK